MEAWVGAELRRLDRLVEGVEVVADPTGRGRPSWNATTAKVDADRVKPSMTSSVASETTASP